jgi:hypothetical protein
VGPFFYPPLASALTGDFVPGGTRAPVPGGALVTRGWRAGHGRLGPPDDARVRTRPATAPDPHMVTLATRPLVDQDARNLMALPEAGKKVFES